MYWAYIIQSETSGRFYCGSTSDVARRVRQHNDPQYVLSKTTKRFEGPWVLVWSEAYSTRAEAMAREKQVKKRGIGRFLAGQQAQAAEGSAKGGIESRRRRD